jgi:hypothetical protein
MPGVLFSVSAPNDAAVLATTSPFSVSSPNTVVMALLGGSTFVSPTNATIWGAVTTFDQAILLDSTRASLYAGTAVTHITGSDLSSSTPYTFYGQFNGSSSRGGVNGVDIGSNLNPGTGTLSSVNIQIGRAGGNFIAEMYMLELFCFPGVSNTDRDNALTYLTGKWGAF